ncbi:hypothetical protein [Ekhidna sp. To15]|uniref:hypothetical protein n=1 Tax=Ekhidna sp. To15 TaxID=3395267 RepID=UPI003F5202E9
MKNLLSAILLLGMISCQQSATEETAEEPTFEIIDTSSSMFAVALDTAVANVDYYDKVVTEVLGIDPIRAFTIRSVDLAESIGLDTKYLKKAEYRHIRIYMGLDSASSQFKIYLTPVKGAKLSAGIPGTDVILTGPYKGDKSDVADGFGDGDGPFVLDFSKPCPNACDDGSPLNE